VFLVVLELSTAPPAPAQTKKEQAAAAEFIPGQAQVLKKWPHAIAVFIARGTD
jgi:hypothetical protein